METAHRITGLAALSTAAFIGVVQLVSGASSAGEDPTLPLADRGYVLHDDLDDYVDFARSGGPPPDGIPAIDDPVFVGAAEAALSPGEKVIGFEHGGVARAYPQRILVHHEIVNDEVGGLNVAVTYCPLTATAQGFRRGDTTLGVSGQLLNSNLVMFDRATETFFAQIAATGLVGEHRGRTLDEVELVWTSWERWRSVHPDTEVLSEDTGYLRNYDRDPYGTYDPVGGYYAQDRTVFPVMHESDRHHAKEMVVGARTEERSGYFVMEELAEEGVLATEHFLALYDPALDTGAIYDTGGEAVEVIPRPDGTYEYEGERYDAGELPLERLVAVEAFFFAWHAFYPRSEYP